MFKLALDAGHGRNTVGKRCHASLDTNETREWVLNSRICEYIQKMLELYSEISVERVDDVTGVTNVTLTTRTNRANHMKADFYLSIHHNAGVNLGSGGGVEAYVYTTVDNTTRQWQKDLYNSIINYTGLKGNRSSGLRSADFAVLRQTNMSAVLLECGFMDSTTDVPIILTDDYARKVAQACVDVILNHAGIAKKPTTKYVGRLDGADRLSVWGWAWNGKDDTPCEVHVYYYKNGEQIKGIPSIIANGFRQDLLDNHIGNGCHAFYNEYDLFANFGEGEYTVKAFVIGGDNPQLDNEVTVSTIQYAAELKAEQERMEAEAKKKSEEQEKNTEEKRLSEEKQIEEEKSKENISIKKSEIISILKKLLQLILKWITSKD